MKTAYMTRRTPWLVAPLLLVMLFVPTHTEAQTPRNPNILFIYLDDPGYGEWIKLRKRIEESRPNSASEQS